MPVNTPTKLSQLAPSSIHISTECRRVRIDDAEEETEQTYLTIEGTPDGLRWLARNLESLARSTEQNGGISGNIVAPWDFDNAPIDLEQWDSIDFTCRPQSR